MQIKRLEIFGFKSFPRKISISFPPGISAIVGPNGSGKSNLVDALRWILGEQNPRLLRVREMSDLIYAGENGFRPEFAEVRLVLDNEKKDGPKELANLSEISVVRRLYRDGESEFFLNNKPCRLKDIVYLFIDSGVYARGYGIIDQGQVSQFIDQSPKERRKHLEQLAGISRYKIRRDETEKQITKTLENLRRIKDILSEVEGRLEELSKQAAEAKKYLSLQEELRNLEIHKLNQEYKKQTEKKEKILEKRKQLEVKVKSLKKEIEQLEPEILECEGKIGILEEELQNLEKKLRDLEEQHQVKRKEINVLFREESNFAKEISQIEGKISANKERQQKIRLRISGIKKEIDEIKKNLPEKEKTYFFLKEENKTITENIKNEERELKELEEATRALQIKLDQISSEIERLDRELALVTKEKEKFIKEVEELNNKKTIIVQRLENLAKEKENYEKKIKAIEDELKEKVKIEENTENDIRIIEEELHELYLRRKELEREVSWLSSFISQSTKGITEVLSKNKIKFELALNQVDLTEEEEKIIDHVYQDLTKAIILKNRKDLPKAIEVLSNTNKKAVLFIGNDINSVLKEKTKNIQIVKSLEEANIEEEKKYLIPEKNILVTPDGFVFVSSSKSEELLKKKKRLETLVKEKEQILLKIKEKESKNKILKERQEKLKKEISQLAAQKEESVKKIKNYTKEMQQNQINLEKIENNLEILQKNIFFLEEKINSIKNEIEEKASKKEPLKKEFKTFEEKLFELKEKYEREKRHKLEISKKLREIEIELIRKKEKKETLTKELQKQIEEESILAQQIEKFVYKKDKINTNWQQIKKKIKELKSILNSQQEEINSIKGVIEEKKKKLDHLRKREKELRNIVYEKTKELENEEKALNRISVDLAQTELTLAHLAEQAYQNFKIFLPLNEENEEKIRIKDINKRILEVKEELDKFGLINLAAIEELEKTKERKNFLISQKEDLEKALDDLKAAVKQINQTCRKRLKRALAAANEKLAQIFPVLFPEASAELRFTESEDPLEAGLDLIVKLPGKPIRHLAMLSGGEKALTALAVLCAFYLVKPGPFCVLDEVDAPLDEANTEKFVNLLRELTKHSQVILVTHNKRVMENADLLIGVTMEEKGISKIVSVSLN
ncbi:chromosome segregation protein SMC [Thermodesulfatator atlanticus]|uniref:chromosome segregation protein SMC n=1 Tax=Thermodesulfatator atlanticus TaxID=501497 RepID=UPI0003B704E0|nr:chromosome segregation protein SMC [Thermodesulfatator atlanticus]